MDRPLPLHRMLLTGLAVAIAYYLGAQLGFGLLYSSSTLSVLWPPNAVLLVALLLLPLRLWWLPIVAGLVAHIAVFPLAGWDRVIALYATNALQALLGAGLLWWIAARPFALDSLRNTILFLVLAVIATPVLASFPGTVAAVLDDFGRDFWFNWRLRVVSNAATTIALVPAALTVSTLIRATREVSPPRMVEAGAILAALIVMGIVSLRGTQPSVLVLPLLLGAGLALLIWIAIRFGIHGTSLGLLAMTAMTFVNVGRWEPLLAPDDARVLVQIFLIVGSAPALLLAAYSEERRQAIATLRRAEQRYRLATNAGLTGVWDWNLDNDHLFVDPLLKNLLGFADDEIPNSIGEWRKHQHPDDAAGVATKASGHIAGVTPSFESEHRMLHKDGSTRWFLARGAAIRDGRGTARRMVGTYTDVSERRRVQDDLAAVERLSTAVLASMHDAVAILDRNGRIETANEMWMHFAEHVGTRAYVNGGRGMNYVAGCRELAARGELDAAALADAIAAVLTGERPTAVLEYAVKTPAGERWLETSILPLRRPDGGAMVTHADISKRKLIDAELQNIRLELAHLGRVTMLGELSGAMAHELNQPLTAILSNAQAGRSRLARSPVDPIEIGAILADIVRDGTRAGDVIRRLRELMSKSEAQLQPIAVNEIVEDVLKLAQSELLTRGVVASAKLAAALPQIAGDSVQLRQLLLNLIVNAAEALATSRRDDRRITIVTTRHSAGQVRVSVSDSGKGLARAQLDQVFEPFYTTKSQGLGLGLAICRSIVMAHGGRIWATSNVAGGATFHFTLPLAADRPALHAAEQAAPAR